MHPTRIVESTGQASRKQTPQSGDGSAMRCFRGATLMCCVDLVRALLLEALAVLHLSDEIALLTRL